MELTACMDPQNMTAAGIILLLHFPYSLKTYLSTCAPISFTLSVYLEKAILILGYQVSYWQKVTVGHCVMFRDFF